MKKILSLLLALLSLALLAGCNAERKSDDSSAEIPLEAEEQTVSEFVEYYGCPNSKRISKLNLLKRRRTES
ncbi:MAG: lipoprotein [Clostridia bacterium]|nr:lipoprotein [Clostridia bacterium]